MPCGGLAPFLRTCKRSQKIRRESSVNALWRASSISTQQDGCGIRHTQKNVSMPCGGLAPFLRPRRKKDVSGGLRVSMPCGGLAPFLR